MGTQERRERERQEVRERILDAARTLFVTEGYEAVTMRRVAEAIEYSATAIYAHFADKAALMRELCRNDFRIFGAKFAKLLAVKDPVERMRRAGHAYIDFAAAYPHHYKLMFMTQRPLGEVPADHTDKGNPEADAYAFLLATSEELVRGGHARPGIKDAQLLAQTFWAGVHGVASMAVSMGGEGGWVDWRSLDKRARLMNDALIDGLLVRR